MRPGSSAVSALSLCAGTASAVPIGRGSRGGMEAVRGAPLAAPKPRSQRKMPEAFWELCRAKQAPCLPCCGWPTRLSTAQSAVLTGATRVPFQAGVLAKMRRLSNPTTEDLTGCGCSLLTRSRDAGRTSLLGGWTCSSVKLPGTPSFLPRGLFILLSQDFKMTELGRRSLNLALIKFHFDLC